MKPKDNTHIYLSNSKEVSYVKVIGNNQYHWSKKKQKWFMVEDFQKYSLSSLVEVK